MSNISYYKHAEINKVKWDALVNSAVEPLPYAFTWYLDAVAGNKWDALVLNDYEAVMPLVWMRKLGVKCLYQPYYCQQSGVFSRAKLLPSVIEEFIDNARQKFAYIDINLRPLSGSDNVPLLKKKNLLLDLAKGYGALKKNYSENHRRNVAKAIKSGLRFEEYTGLGEFQKFYLQNIDRKKENFKTKHEQIFKKISAAIIEKGEGKIFTTVGDDGTLYAATLVVFCHNRMIGIINTSSAAGKKNGASHFVFDGLIQKYAGAGKVLDFEGSSIATIARFYEGFGAQEEVFYRYKHSVISAITQRFS